MKHRWKGRVAIAGVLLGVSAFPAVISAETFEQSIKVFAYDQSYQKSFKEQIKEEARPMKESLETLNVVAKAENFPQKYQYHISDKEVKVLSRIVEAEATGKDMKSKILVANVVLNRWKSEEFPNTIQGVVFQRDHGAVQFSPTADGRYYSVSITDSTIESVDRALKGEDYSQGALYFVERSIADPDNLNWFDRALTRLFEYQGHAFYK